MVQATTDLRSMNKMIESLSKREIQMLEGFRQARTAPV
jgi:hypothetical protein